MRCLLSRHIARRRELLEKQGQRFGLRQIRRAVERGELPARLDVELASIYLQSLWDGICGTLAWTERLRDDRLAGVMIGRSAYDDPWAFYAWLRAEHPVWFDERSGLYAVSRHADVVTASRDFH